MSTELASLRKEGAVELETDGTGTLETEGAGAVPSMVERRMKESMGEEKS